MKLVSDNDTPRGNKPEPEMAIPSPAIPHSPRPLPTNFKDYPQSVSEVRSENENNASVWTVRDVLVAMLRDIDSGDIKHIDNFAIVFGGNAEPKQVGYLWSSKDPVRLIGMLLKTAHDLAG